MPDDFAAQVTAWRRHLHAHPELSLKESATASFVCARLDEMGIPYEAGIGGHGVVATLKRGGSNRSVGLRADMDALPIPEATGKPYSSTNPGVMHACGHDGHTASLLGAARMLKDDPDWSGQIHLVFQPAEEGYGGAQSMLDDGLLTRFPMERIFGYHNWPGCEAGEIGLRSGPFLAGVAKFTITMKGVAGHSSTPQVCKDPVQGIGQLIVAINSIVARNVDPRECGVISTCILKASEAYNQIPETAMLGGTMRAFSPAVMTLMQRRLTELAKNIAAAMDLEAEVSIWGELKPTVNTEAETELAAQAAKAAGLKVGETPEPHMGSEDFGCFLHQIPGNFAMIGNGVKSPGLHSQTYDYNDEILPVAAKFLAECAKTALR